MKMDIIKSENKPTLANIKDSLDNLIVRVLDGNEDALEVFGMLKKVEKLSKDNQGRIYDLARTEADKEPATSFQRNGLIIEKRSGGKRFDFKHIAEWIIANAYVKEIEDKYKKAWHQNEKGQLEPDPETGEILQMPKVTYTKDSIIVK